MNPRPTTLTHTLSSLHASPFHSGKPIFVTRVAIGIGSNLGDRLANMQAALRSLQGHVQIERVSPVYETEPMYVHEQPLYLNAAATGITSLGPLALLSLLKDTEHAIGRTPTARMGPREIDLDLLVYGRAAYRFVTSEGKRLVVPHPRTPERGFVLRPLCDIAPDLQLPAMGCAAELLLELERKTPATEKQYGVLSL